MTSQEYMPLPGRGPSASEALLSKSKSGTMPTYATPFIDEKLRAEVEFFKQWGFLVVEDAITPEQVAQLSDALDAAYERTKDDKRSGGGAPNPDAKDHFIHNVLEEDPAAFGFLLDNPPVVLRMRAILGSAVQLHSATARYVSPGMPDQQWHRDGGFPVDVDSDYRFGQINCGYFLDELTPELGPTMLVPGSHRSPFRPPAPATPGDPPPKFPEEIRVLAKPGQAVMFDSYARDLKKRKLSQRLYCFHRGSANTTTDSHRRSIFMCYHQAWVAQTHPGRPHHDTPNIATLREHATPDQLMLLGELSKAAPSEAGRSFGGKRTPKL